MIEGVQYFPQTEPARLRGGGQGPWCCRPGWQRSGYSRMLTWFDRSGKQARCGGTAALVAKPGFRPMERRVALEQTDHDGRHVDVWTHNLASDASHAAPFGPGIEEASHLEPRWEAGAFTSSDDTLFFSLYLTSADGAGTSGEGSSTSKANSQTAWDWSRDGKYVLTAQGRRAVVHDNGRPAAAARWSRNRGRCATPSFPPTASSWLTLRMKLATRRFLFLLFPHSTANGRCRAAPEARSPAGAVTAKNFSISRPTVEIMNRRQISRPVPAFRFRRGPRHCFLTSPQPPVSALHFFSYDVNG